MVYYPNKHKPPFVIKLYAGKYHLVRKTHGNHYVTACWFQINFGTIDDREKGRRTMLRKRDLQDSWRDFCGHCRKTYAWRVFHNPNVNYKIVPRL